MHQRTLGQDLTVSAIGLGCMGMSAFYGSTDEGEAIATIRRALDLGCTFLDTAEMYGPFTNEELVGRATAGRRDEVVLATKFGIRFEPTPDNPMNRVVDGSPENVRRLEGDNLERNQRLVAKGREIAAEKGCAPGQLALAWVLAQGDDIVPIPGTKRRTYLEENLAAVDVSLTAEDLERIDAEIPSA